jgi:hypothetical protein
MVIMSQVVRVLCEGFIMARIIAEYKIGLTEYVIIAISGIILPKRIVVFANVVALVGTVIGLWRTALMFVWIYAGSVRRDQEAGNRVAEPPAAATSTLTSASTLADPDRK